MEGEVKGKGEREGKGKGKGKGGLLFKSFGGSPRQPSVPHTHINSPLVYRERSKTINPCLYSSPSRAKN